MAQTFLQLPPELGGLRYGPFDQWIQVGSDPRRNQIVLDPGHGVFPAHCAIGQLPDGRYSVTPVTPECKVFLMPAGQGQVWPLHGPVQANAGDMVIFGTPAGPRFTIIREAPVKGQSAAQIVRSARQVGGEKGFIQGASGIGAIFRPTTQGGISGEIQRRMQAKALATPGPMRTAYEVWTRYRYGSLTSPYFIVGALSAVVGMLGTGTVSCSGFFYVLWQTLGLQR
jgi:hypothetical protein